MSLAVIVFLLALFPFAVVMGRILRARARAQFGPLVTWAGDEVCEHGHPHASKVTADACTGDDYWRAVTTFRR
jgi:hypothetical protein